jgi:hypothetical protein
MSVYKDFVPKMVAPPKGILRLQGLAEYEHFDAAAEAAVAWITSNNIRVLSIETVVLPGIPEIISDNSGVLRNLGTAIHYQFVRVWYLEN